MNWKRAKVITYLYPYEIDVLTFGSSFPDNYINIDILFKPFGQIVWFFIILSLILFTIFDQTKNYFKIIHKENLQKPNKQRRHNGNLFWIGIHILLKQNYHQINSLYVPSKICVIGWIISALVLANYYSGFLCSTLTIPNSIEINSLEKLAEACLSQKYKVLGKKITGIDVLQVIFFIFLC